MSEHSEGAPHLAEALRLASLGRLDDAELLFSRISTTDAAYRPACVALIDLCRRRGEVTFRADHVLQSFVAGPPETDEERAALRTLAALYDEQGHDDLASEVRALVEEAKPRVPTLLPGLPPLPPAKKPSAPSGSNGDGGSVVVTSPSQAATLPIPRAPEATIRSDATSATDTGVWASLSKSLDVEIDEAPPPTPVPTPPSPTPAQRSATTSRAPSSESGRSAFQIGAVVNDRYEIMELLGKGGMATVFRVFDRELDEAVALKLFLQQVSDDEENVDVARFKRELKLARRLRHPNVVQLFDLGTFAGHYYITLELLDGEDLHRVLRRQKNPWSPGDAVAIALQICEGLEAAHALGVVHRDIKPANIFVPRKGPLKIMDFGIAKGAADAGDLATKTGMMMGTPQYMAPEQAQDAARVGPESDLYALGVILFELLTGRRPFDGTNLMGVLVDVVTKPPPFIFEIRRDLPPELSALVMRLLAKSPEDRPRSAREVKALLAPFKW